MPLVPSYLVVITVILVVLPSVAAILLRFALHRHLVFLEERVRRLINRGERGNQPEIVKELEIRFGEASRNLEQVNTVALIDQSYSQEKVWSISCEQIDYFCRILPNLLLAFGLLGTFLGITINLSALSQTISQTNTSDVSSLVSELQEPLKGMGIAFTTSLTGLFFSAVLTIVNLIKNTSLAKYKIISSLEDYLDNIYQPTIPGHTRIDKALDRLVFEFKDFLGRFGTTVRDAVESSLGEKIKQIANENKKATELANRVYNGFQESSGTIERGANDIKIAADRFTEVAQTFKHSQFAQLLSHATENLASTQRNFSQSASSLAESAATIKIAGNELQSYSQKLVNLREEINSINQTSIQVLELHQNSQQSLGEIIPQLQQGAQSYQSSVTTLDQLQKQILDRTDRFDDVQAELTKLVETSVSSLAESVATTQIAVIELQSNSQRVVNLGEEISSINQTSIQVLELHQSGQQSLAEIIPQLQQGAQSYQSSVTTLNQLQNQILDRTDRLGNNVQVELIKLVETLKNHTEQANLGIQSLGDRIIKNDKYQTYVLVQKLQECINYSNDTKQEIDTLTLRKTLQKQGRKED